MKRFWCAERSRRPDIPVRPTTPFHFYQVYRDVAFEMGESKLLQAGQECPACDSESDGILAQPDVTRIDHTYR